MGSSIYPGRGLFYVSWGIDKRIEKVFNMSNSSSTPEPQPLTRGEVDSIL